ncbi:MAG TPA: protein phosphatase 2C domain-containing protein [Terriglobales bacterium]|jgi:protein phosphatase
MKSRSLSDKADKNPDSHPVLDVEFAQLSDTGRVREHNEDHVGHFLPTTPALVRTHGFLFVLADGVGGHEKGEIASQTAVECMLAGFRNASGHDPHSSLLPHLIKEANLAVFEGGGAADRNSGSMATTVVACALRFDHASIAHVGDSRCYLIRDGQATLLTHDHTVANEQLRMGLLGANEAANLSTSHVLSRSVGSEMLINVETADIQIFVGDVFVLCSDGLHNSVEASDIANAAAQSATLDIAARTLVTIANQRDGTDNISVQLVRVRSVERIGTYRGRPYWLR